MAKVENRLTRALSPEDAERLPSYWQASGFIRELVCKLLEEDIQKSLLESDNPTLCDSPNALAKLRELSGVRQGLRKAIALLSDER